MLKCDAFLKVPSFPSPSLSLRNQIYFYQKMFLGTTTCPYFVRNCLWHATWVGNCLPSIQRALFNVNFIGFLAEYLALPGMI